MGVIFWIKFWGPQHVHHHKLTEINHDIRDATRKGYKEDVFNISKLDDNLCQRFRNRNMEDKFPKINKIYNCN